METNNPARKYRTIVKSRACENFGAVNYSITDTITEIPGGLRVETHTLGTCEGERVDQRASKEHAGATIERAEAYRLSHGYTRIA